MRCFVDRSPLCKWIVIAGAPELGQRPPSKEPGQLKLARSRSVAGGNRECSMLKWLGFHKAIRASTSLTNMWIESARGAEK